MAEGAVLEDVTKLKGWPEVGKTYLVPSVWTGGSFFPVFPDGHTDDEMPTMHWHVDARFVTEGQEAELAANWKPYLASLRKIGVRREAAAELSLPDALKCALMMGFSDPTGNNRVAVQLRPMVCRYACVPWDAPPRDHYWIEKKYLPRAPRDGTLKAIRSADGRPICPHQKFDLTCVWDGKSSHVRCPMHGLLIDVSACRQEVEANG